MTDGKHSRWRRALAWAAAVLAVVAFSELAADRALKRAERRQKELLDRPQVQPFTDRNRLHVSTEGSTNVLRVAVIGDSIVLGSQVLFSDTFGVRLERLLNLNSGVSPAIVDLHAEAGTSTATQRRLFDLALKDDPQVVLFVISLNDAQDRRRGKEELVEWQEEAAPWSPPPALKRLFDKSRTLTWALAAYQKSAGRKGDIGLYRHLLDPSYVGWQRFAGAIREYRDACRERGVAMAVVFMPALGELDDYPFTFAHRQFGQFLEQERIPCLDLLEDLQSKATDRMMSIPGRDGHPSEIAHRIIAGSIFEFLIGCGAIPDAYVPAHMNYTRNDFMARCRKRAPASAAVAAQAPSAPPAAKAATLMLRAKLARRVETPSLEAIKPYKSALVVYVYEIEQVEAGSAPAEKRIAVAHWGIRDEKVIPLDRRVGDSYALRLERFADHPEIEGERQIIDDDAIPLPLYFDVGN